VELRIRRRTGVAAEQQRQRKVIAAEGGTPAGGGVGNGGGFQEAIYLDIGSASQLMSGIVPPCFGKSIGKTRRGATAGMMARSWEVAGGLVAWCHMKDVCSTAMAFAAAPWPTWLAPDRRPSPHLSPSGG